MKRALSLILALTMCLSLCACGGGSSKFTITCKDGTTETMSADELTEVSSNDVKYKQKYAGAHVSGEVKIESIDASITTSKGHIEAVDIGFGYMDLILTDVPSEYVANLDIGDTITVSGTISKTPIGWIEIKADSFYKGGDDSTDEAKAVYDSLYELKDGFAFIVKYTENFVGANGYAEENLLEPLAALDAEYINENLPETAKALPEIQNSVEIILVMIDDMCVNSNDRIEETKELANEVIALIDTLFNGELTMYNY